MKPAIPKTDSIEELARFWDTHDLTDYFDELPEVPSPFARGADAVRIVLAPDEHDAIRKLATTQGVEESALIHEWVKERLHHP
jgi:hypothetical protein